MKKIFIMGMVLASLGQNAMAGTVILKSDEGAGSFSIFKLGVVAKIKRDLQMLISNGGFTAPASEVNGTEELQGYAFGHSQSLPNDAEDYVINPLLPLAGSALQNHVCGVSASPEAQSVHKLILGSLDKLGASTGASCAVSEIAGVKSVAATFKSKLEVKASGGLTGQFSVAMFNGIESDLLAVDAAVAFKTASVAIDSALDSIAPSNHLAIGQGQEAEDLDVGDITYSMGFDLNGPFAKAVSRVGFIHTLMAD